VGKTLSQNALSSVCRGDRSRINPSKVILYTPHRPNPSIIQCRMPPPSGSVTAGHAHNAHGPPRKSGGGTAPVVVRGAGGAASSSSHGKGHKGGTSSGGKQGRRSERSLVDVKAPPPPPSPPKVGDYCCVYLEQCSDYFRPRIFDAKLGGWHPARILQVEKAADAAASSSQAGAPSSASAAGAPPGASYHLTVSSEFFPGRKKFRYPSEHNLVMLMVPSNEDYASLSLRGDPDSIIFQAQPEMLYPGDLVFARYQAGDRWHRGRVVAVYEEEYAPMGDVDGEEGNGNGKDRAPLPPMVASAAGADVGGGRVDGDNGAAVGAAAAAAAGEPSREEEEAAMDVEGTGEAGGAGEGARAGGLRRYVCSIAYDGGGDNGRATLETGVPFTDGSHDDPGMGSDEDFCKAKPYVYLAQRGRDDVRWLQFELDRMSRGNERLTLRPDQQVVDREGDSRDVLPLAAQQLDSFVVASDATNGSGSGNNARQSLEFLYFAYDDVVRCVFEVARKRHGTSLLDIEWPTQPRIQKLAGSRKRKKR
jgi:hypothetical protein